LTLTEVRDHLPQILAKLSDALGSATSAQTRELINQTGLHGAIRFQEGYNIEELLIEYRLLRRVIIEQVETALGRRTTTDEDVALSMGIDTVLHEGVAAFVRDQNALLQAATRAEAKYLSFLSHDLRGHLNGISLTMEIIKRRLEQGPGFAEEVADIQSLQNSVRSTVEGMERLLQAERLRRQEVTPKIGSINLHRLASELAHEFSHQAEMKGIKLAVDVPPDLTIQSDEEWVRIVLQNLLGNAIKYSTKGTVRIQTTGCETIAVADEGPGIAPEALDRIFEEFTRGDTQGQRGVGLGLAIASQAARLLGGQLTVQSEIGRGTIFCLALPKA
jgi:signal transduction histidine kinase